MGWLGRLKEGVGWQSPPPQLRPPPFQAIPRAVHNSSIPLTTCLPSSDHLLGPPLWDPSHPSRVTNFGFGGTSLRSFWVCFFHFVQRNILFKSVF